jgi:type IV secretion system protein TrbE
VEIFYGILLEGSRSKTGVGAAFSQLFRDSAGAFGELKAQFTNDNMKTLLRDAPLWAGRTRVAGGV